MLKENQNKLKHKIDSIIKEIGHMNSIKQEIGKEFIERNLSAYRAMNVFMGNEDIHTLSDSDEDIRFLFFFTDSLNKALKRESDLDLSIDVEEYFTQLEYKQWKNYIEESKPEEDYPIIFEDVQQIAEGMWQTVITSQRFAQLDRNNRLLYSFKNQRNPKITVSGIKIDLDKRKVMKIKERILNRTQFSDHVRINILKDYTEEIYYNSKAGTLTINKGLINLIDGQHRKVANSLAIEENPEVLFNWGLVITNYTENDIRDFILQINEQKPFKQEQKEEWNLSKKENLVVSVIADDRISKLAKVMKSQYNEIKLNKGLVTKNIIAEAIAENYELDDTTNIRGLGQWIVEFTDYLFSLYPNEFILNPYSMQDTSVINHRNMFYGYIALSAKLYNNNNWKEITKNIMQSIDFRIENQLWKDIGMLTNNKVNKSLKTKMYKLFIGKGEV